MSEPFDDSLESIGLLTRAFILRQRHGHMPPDSISPSATAAMRSRARTRAFAGGSPRLSPNDISVGSAWRAGAYAVGETGEFRGRRWHTSKSSWTPTS